MVHVGSARLDIVQGDITDQNTDAIVNAANNHLWMGAGVAGAIKARGGAAIESEAISLGPVPVGRAVLTSGGTLEARHVIHAAGMGQDLKTDVTKVAAATRSSLELADKSGLQSIAFPAIGTGVGGLSLGACAKTMIDATVHYLLDESSGLVDIRFVLFNSDATSAFHEALVRKFSSQRKRGR